MTRILYVDDDRSNRIVFEQSFGRILPVVVTASGDEALARLEDGGVGVVVTDQRMPGMTGNTLLERVRALYPDIVRIVITAYSDVDEILRAVNAGLVARYIVKPWERTELEEVLRWALEVHARGREDSTVQARLIEAERLITLGSIAAALLHDLAQPVAVAQVNATRLAELSAVSPALLALVARHSKELDRGDAETARHLGEETGEIAADLLAGLSQMQEMLEQIRRLARKPAPSDPKRTNPVAVLRFVAGACRSLAVRTGTRLTLDVAGELPLVAMTTTEFTQVMMNIVRNAVQAVEKTSGGLVSVTARADADALLLTVEDDGPGIPAAILEKVGKPFFSTRAEGTGLGVAQCRRMVGGAGGTFRLESVEGAGTRVFVRVPWAG